jgi:Fic family protein
MKSEPNIGTYRQQPQGFRAFIPGVFPIAGMLNISPRLAKKHEEATRLVGKLDGISQLLPDQDFFLRMFIVKDASSSSQIEGTQATMMDAVEAESKERGIGLPADVDDILHYIEAVNYGLKRAESLPLSLRFITELHGKLMTGARQTHPAYPGEFRRSQNWIGGTRPSNARFVPPPVEEMKKSLTDLEKFMRAEDEYLPLIKAGLLHAQFEAIHPFNDGNGRTGRMLVTMFIWHCKLLEVPVLYLSSYFKKYQDTYYERLDRYHAEPSHIEEWLDFFLDGVIETARSAINTCKKITALREQDMRKSQSLGKTAAKVTVNVLRNLYAQPIVSAADIAEWTGYSRQGAYNVITRLVKLNILQPLRDSDNYGQKYIYQDYFNLFYEEE